MQAVLWLLVGALLSLLVTVLLSDAAESAFVRLLGPWASRRGRDISGPWFTIYLVTRDRHSSPSATWRGKKVEEIRLYKIGSHVVGRSPTNKRYGLRARLEEGILTGTWEHFLDGSDYWGSFQLLWGRTGNTMGGKFLGMDSANHINHGIWLWARKPEQLLPLAERMNERFGYDFDVDEVRRILEGDVDEVKKALEG
jgi:hypothetical protein